MLPRTFLHTKIIAPRKPKVSVASVVTSKFRVWPTDIDILLHMNNGKYLSILDIGRLEYVVQTGVLAEMNKRGWYTVVGAQTIAYRKSLEPFQKFQVETALLGVDQRAVYLEQRFVRKGEIYARAYIQGRVLKKTGGTVDMAEFAAAVGFNTADHPLPTEFQDWTDFVRLPSTKREAPSTWN